MRILSRLLGSNRELKVPDVNSAPWLEVDYSGNQLRFKNPPHTAMFPPRYAPIDTNIFDIKAEPYKKGEHDSGYTLSFFTRGWSFRGARGKSIGGVRIHCSLCFYQKLPEKFSLFEKDQFEETVIALSLRSWGWQNKGAKAGSLGTGSLVFPVLPSDLRYEVFNGNEWCRMEGGKPGTPAEYIYALALTSKHLLLVIINRETYNGIDFYSPETNIEAASNQFVSDFMNNFFITPSEEIKAQREAARKRELGARDADVASSL